jgi:hypothetical protein
MHAARRAKNTSKQLAQVCCELRCAHALVHIFCSSGLAGRYVVSGAPDMCIVRASASAVQQQMYHVQLAGSGTKVTFCHSCPQRLWPLAVNTVCRA